MRKEPDSGRSSGETLRETDLGGLDAEACLERMEQLEKEGTNFMNIQKTDVHKKKIRGAFLGAGIMLVLMAGMVGMILWGNSADPLPIGWLLFLIAIPVAL